MVAHSGRRGLSVLLGLILMAEFLAHSLALAGPPEDYRLIWGDDFELGFLDSTKWSVGVRERDNAQQTREAIAVYNGVLHIGIYTSMGRHFTGFLTTPRLFSTRDGYFEARVRFRGVSGAWCAFWLQSPLFGRRIGVPRESGVEVDVVEYRKHNRKGGDISDSVEFNLHWDGYGAFRKSVGEVWRSKATLEAEWHTYAVLSSPEGFNFFVDGVSQWRTDRVSTEAQQEIRLTCEIRDNSWAGEIPSGGFGEKGSSEVGMDVDWVRVWGRS